MRRRRLRIGRVLDCFSSSLQCAGGCVCVRALDDEEDAAVEREALVASGRRRQQLQDQVLRLRDLVDGTRTLGFHLQPKTVELRVSMHCNGCAKKVHKHISKMEVALVASQTELSSRFMPKLCYSRHLSGNKTTVPFRCAHVPSPLFSLSLLPFYLHWNSQISSPISNQCKTIPFVPADHTSSHVFYSSPTAA
ncbi:uncharacterized protein LOC120698018 isoform X1 [Panicum virgatum]|uniref:uncharacterized protein LOC120698018 isoform X1 n=1 Tax=Panicum virgatum TaxID=38727 RepID=UPI0019D58AF6|nr:uncharacterized protein LOC120698018 isoform X1 [Panicum virgatum]